MKVFFKRILFVAFGLTLTITLKQSAFASIYPFNLNYSGLQEVPPNASPATGTIIGTYDDVTNTINYTISFSGMIGTTTAGHFHGPAGVGVNGPVIVGYLGFPVGVTNGVYANSNVLTDPQEVMLLTGNVYSNLHTSAFPGGEIRTQMILEAPLPVELASFTSIVVGNDVTLNWTTSSETNNSGFDIERSSNGTWMKIGFVEGAGNSTVVNEYTFSDKALQSGAYQYRLRQIDYNGNFEYFELSSEVIVGLPVEYELSQNFPNPFNPSTKINFELPEGSFVSLKVFDMSGREVASPVNEVLPAGYHSVQFNSSGLSSGIYFYTLNANGFVSTKKMVLAK